ncbi:MAG: TetR/AcrR family transcriptional regulator [Deltaproteobacteria bacterium]|nr:MAG: TetR/AcrR family transcriptional regulator [Deltaproteobacteria bacterium]
MSRKEVILDGAAWLFSEKGFRDASMAELAKMTGVAQGTIFYHFKNKEELFLAILENIKEEIIREFDGYIRDHEFQNGLDMLEGAISFYLHLAGTMEDRFILLHRHDAYSFARVNPTYREQLEAIYERLLDFFERAIRVGQEDGSIREVAARKAALIIFNMVDGLVRLETYDLYSAGALYNELIDSCRRMLRNERSQE